MKSIPMKTWEVQAILDNRKTVTRRVVKQQDKILENPEFGYTAFTPEGYISVRGGWKDEDGKERYGENFIKLPYRPNDVLYVCETWTQDGDVYRYKAGFYDQNRKWRSSVHMPRKAARIFLRVTDVRVERLQEITEEQARAEGVEPLIMTADVDKPDSEKRWQEVLPASTRFPEVWDSTIKPADRALYGWEANPWVWVIEFERISKEEVQNEAD